MDLERSNWKAWLPVFGGLYLYIGGPPSWAREWMAHSFLNSNNSAPLKIRKIIYGPRCQDLESRHLGIQGRSKIGALPSTQRECIWSQCLCLMPSGGLPGPCPKRPSWFLQRERFWAAGRAPAEGAESPLLQGGTRQGCSLLQRWASGRRGNKSFPVSRVMMRMIWIEAKIHVVGVASFGNVRRSRASPSFQHVLVLRLVVVKWPPRTSRKCEAEKWGNQRAGGNSSNDLWVSPTEYFVGHDHTFVIY